MFCFLLCAGLSGRTSNVTCPRGEDDKIEEERERECERAWTAHVHTLVLARERGEEGVLAGRGGFVSTESHSLSCFFAFVFRLSGYD